MLNVCHQAVSIPFLGFGSAWPACTLAFLVSYPGILEGSAGLHSVSLRRVEMLRSPLIYHHIFGSDWLILFCLTVLFLRAGQLVWLVAD